MIEDWINGIIRGVLETGRNYNHPIVYTYLTNYNTLECFFNKKRIDYYPETNSIKQLDMYYWNYEPIIEDFIDIDLIRNIYIKLHKQRHGHKHSDILLSEKARNKKKLSEKQELEISKYREAIGK